MARRGKMSGDGSRRTTRRSNTIGELGSDRHDLNFLFEAEELKKKNTSTRRRTSKSSSKRTARVKSRKPNNSNRANSAKLSKSEDRPIKKFRFRVFPDSDDSDDETSYRVVSTSRKPLRLPSARTSRFSRSRRSGNISLNAGSLSSLESEGEQDGNRPIDGAFNSRPRSMKCQACPAMSDTSISTRYWSTSRDEQSPSASEPSTQLPQEERNYLKKNAATRKRTSNPSSKRTARVKSLKPNNSKRANTAKLSKSEDRPLKKFRFRVVRDSDDSDEETSYRIVSTSRKPVKLSSARKSRFSRSRRSGNISLNAGSLSSLESEGEQDGNLTIYDSFNSRPFSTKYQARPAMSDTTISTRSRSTSRDETSLSAFEPSTSSRGSSRSKSKRRNSRLRESEPKRPRKISSRARQLSSQSNIQSESETRRNERSIKARNSKRRPTMRTFR